MSAIHCVNGEVNSADTAFMAFTTTLVMLQTPAMGIAQAGMIKRKNALSMLMQTVSGMAIGSILWFLIGFTLTFGPSNGGFIGGLKYSFLMNIPSYDCLENQPADTIPGSLFVAYQCMFALMVPVIVTGAWAEKMTFKAYLIFIIAWPLLVYYPIAHWIWNNDGWLNKLGALDFAGGAVIHATSGVAGLIVSFAIPRRKKNIGLSHHNLPISILGGCMVWGGWYSFNGGASYKANFQAAGALLNTHLSACCGGFAWVLLSYRKDGFWKLTELINGAFAGLASITAGSGMVSPWAACVIGIISGSTSWYGVRFFKEYLHLDDVLDVTSLQGVPGVFGTILVGFFANAEMQPANAKDGIFYGGGFHQLGIQVLTASVALVWAGVFTGIIVFIMKHTVRIDVDPEVEEKGLDICQLGEQAYDDQLTALLDLGQEALTVKLCDAAFNGDLVLVQELLKLGADPTNGDYDGRTPYHLAAAEGRLEVLEFLYKYKQVNLDLKDKLGNTPLLEAFKHRRTKVIKFLVSKGCKLKGTDLINDFFETCTRGDTKELRRFLAAKINVNIVDYDKRSALHIAASDGSIDCVNLLLEYGANADAQDRWGYTPLECSKIAGHTAISSLLENVKEKRIQIKEANASEEGSINSSYFSGGELINRKKSDNSGYLRLENDLAQPLLEDKTMTSIGGSGMNITSIQTVSPSPFKKIDTTAMREICTAAAEGNLEEFNRLLKKGASPYITDYDGRTPLHLAVCNGHSPLVEYLCSIKSVNINAQDRWHQTPLSEAVKNNYNEVARILRVNGAIMINKQIGYKLCKLASENKLKELQKIALEGTDLSLGDYDGRTAMHLAASNGHRDIVEFLISQGINLKCRDRYGNTPYDDAVRSGYKEIADVIEKAMNYVPEHDKID